MDYWSYLGCPLHNACNQFHIDSKQTRRFATIQPHRCLFLRSTRFESRMAISFQFRTIFHFIADDYWNGYFLSLVRISHSRNSSNRISIDVAIYRMGFLCWTDQYSLSLEFDEIIQTLSSPVLLINRRTTTPMTIRLIPKRPAASIFWS